MGWENSHLHAFNVGSVTYADPDPDFGLDFTNREYTYPRFVDGRNACPPEDVGGSLGYESFLTRIRRRSLSFCAPQRGAE